MLRLLYESYYEIALKQGETSDKQSRIFNIQKHTICRVFNVMFL